MSISGGAMPRTITAVDADLYAKTRQTYTAEVRAEVDALLDERLRLRRPLRPSQVLARG